jgi:hypothetical protein
MECFMYANDYKHGDDAKRCGYVCHIYLGLNIAESYHRNRSLNTVVIDFNVIKHF